MGSAFNLGKVFGIQLRLHYTWFIIFVLVTVSLAWQVFPSFYPGWSQSLYWAIGIVTSLLFFASVIAHELAHSLVARVKGVPVKSITLFVFGGVAQITKEAAKPGDELRIAAAGPICSVAIAGLCYLLSVLMQGISAPVVAMAYWLAQVNLLLAVFNLIPGFPLDGGRMFRSALWRFTGNYQRSTRIATRVGRGVGYTFIGGGIVLMFVFQQWLGGMWLAFIGWFLENAASTSYKQSELREALRRLTATQVMTTDCPVVTSDATVNQIVRHYISSGGCALFLVADEGGLSGTLTLHNLKSIPQQKWDTTRAREVMTPVDTVKVAQSDQDALSILMDMEEGNINQMPVVSGGRVIGLVTRDNLVKLLHSRSGSGVPFIK